MQHQSEFYKGVLDHIYDGVYFVDSDRRILYWNSGAEGITGYSADEILGRCCHHNLLNHVDGQGRELCNGACPLADTIRDGASRQAQVYLRHKEGHRVPVRVRVTPWRDENGRIRGAVEIFSDDPHTAAAWNAEAGIRDDLLTCSQTRLPNRQFLEAKLESRLEEYRRCGWSFAVLLIDLDDFAKFNDTYGHRIGDELLLIVARTLSGSLSARDIIGRWEDDEFLAIVSGVYSDRLAAVAERCRALVERSCRISGERPFNVTVSIGATYVHTDDDLPSLVSRARQLLAASKRCGRNCVTLDSREAGVAESQS